MLNYKLEEISLIVAYTWKTSKEPRVVDELILLIIFNLKIRERTILWFPKVSKNDLSRILTFLPVSDPPS